MKVTLNHKEIIELNNVLGRAKFIVEKGATVPILENVLLDATTDGSLVITVTDLEISMVETIAAKIEEKGKITVPCLMFRSITDALKMETELTLCLNPENSMLLVESSVSNYQLAAISADNYPVVQIADLPNKFEMPSHDLIDLLESTEFAMSKEETRYFLNGVYLHAHDNGKLRAVATDGHRMARMETALPKGAEKIPGVIVSRKTVNQILALLKIDTKKKYDEASREEAETTASQTQGNQIVAIGLSDTQVTVKFNNSHLIARLVDGTFPDYENVIPKNNDKSVLFDSARLTSAVDRVSIMSSNALSGVKFAMQNGTACFTAEGNGIGTARETVAVEYTDEPVTIGFSSGYLKDITKRLNSAEARMDFSDESSPVIIRNADNDDALYVLMPMRI